MLTIKRLAIDTYPENTAFLLRQSNGYSAEQFQALRKIRVNGESAEISRRWRWWMNRRC